MNKLEYMKSQHERTKNARDQLAKNYEEKSRLLAKVNVSDEDFATIYDIAFRDGYEAHRGGF